MKILVIGKGGREHALVWKLAQSPRAERGYCAPGNAGTAVDGVNVPLEADDFDRLVRFVRKENIGLTVVGPEEPLARGIVEQAPGPAHGALELPFPGLIECFYKVDAKVITLGQGQYVLDDVRLVCGRGQRSLAHTSGARPTKFPDEYLFAGKCACDCSDDVLNVSGCFVC